jgi:hypothetical protein
VISSIPNGDKNLLCIPYVALEMSLDKTIETYKNKSAHSIHNLTETR